MSLQAFRETRARNKRAAIIEAATRMFAARGFQAVSTAALAAEAGVSTATLYRYFDDKASLFGEVIKELADSTIGTLQLASTSDRGRLETLAHSYADLLSDPTVVGLIRAVVAEQPDQRNRLPDHLEMQGNGILTQEFLNAVTDRILRDNPQESASAQQASIELRGVLEHMTLLPQLLFREQPDLNSLHADVEVSLASWKRRWLAQS
jgi:AcrR family transcriptional regulator